MYTGVVVLGKGGLEVAWWSCTDAANVHKVSRGLRDTRINPAQ